MIHARIIEENSGSKVGRTVDIDSVNKSEIKECFWVKNIFILVILFTPCIHGVAQRGNYPNPVAVYCEKMGYKYQIDYDNNGNQKGFCILPDDSKIDAWDFYKGEIKKEYSYCARNGYSMATKVIKENGFIIECPYCVNDNSDNRGFNEIPMTKLMKLYSKGNGLRIRQSEI
jgi:putative hemolysin